MVPIYISGMDFAESCIILAEAFKNFVASFSEWFVEAYEQNLNDIRDILGDDFITLDNKNIADISEDVEMLIDEER